MSTNLSFAPNCFVAGLLEQINFRLPLYVSLQQNSQIGRSRNLASTVFGILLVVFNSRSESFQSFLENCCSSQNLFLEKAISIRSRFQGLHIPTQSGMVRPGNQILSSVKVDKNMDPTDVI